MVGVFEGSAVFVGVTSGDFVGVFVGSDVFVGVGSGVLLGVGVGSGRFGCGAVGSGQGARICAAWGPLVDEPKQRRRCSRLVA